MKHNPETIATCGALPLFRAVFGLQPAQTLSEFVQEVATLKTDEKFVSECRAYALAYPDALV